MNDRIETLSIIEIEAVTGGTSRAGPRVERAVNALAGIGGGGMLGYAMTLGVVTGGVAVAGGVVAAGLVAWGAYNAVKAVTG